MNENILSRGEVNYLKSSIEPLTHRLNEYSVYLNKLRRIDLVYNLSQKR
ncbi:hypothetical protein GM3709_3003 [Geminocystis sp. NIES-3709]|nr:hypothetical protein GM3709_3003 [Geminocystis sp. NIES-3709]